MTAGPDDDRRLDDLLLSWEELRERGSEPTVARLCADCPHLIEPLSRRIAALLAMDQAMHDRTAPASGTGAGAPRRSAARSENSYADLRFHAEGGLGEVYTA